MVFFIFFVSNGGGTLSAAGDPPLFLAAFAVDNGRYSSNIERSELLNCH
ncbi:MAG: sodium:proton antiporter [Verrucomicrobiota bacterium]